MIGEAGANSGDACGTSHGPGRSRLDAQVVELAMQRVKPFEPSSGSEPVQLMKAK
jgi:hypothetical protein